MKETTDTTNPATNLETEFTAHPADASRPEMHSPSDPARVSTALLAQENSTDSAKGHDDDPLVRYSLFRQIKDNEPRACEETWSSLASKLCRHNVRLDKNGPAFSPAVFTTNATRASANVEVVTMIVLDVDDGTSPDHFRSLLAGYRYALYSTHSHTATKPKFRVVVPLVAPVAATDWPQVWLRVQAWTGYKIDAATKDAARIYLMPSHPPGVNDVIAEVTEGRVLDMKDLPQLLPAVVKRAAINPGQSVSLSASASVQAAPHDDEDAELHSQDGLDAMCSRCWFLREAAVPENQQRVSEPLWMGALSNYCRFEGGREAAHEASCEHTGYDPQDVDSRLERYRQVPPMTCREIRARGFTGCPADGCPLPNGSLTRAPAGLHVWSRANFSAKDFPQPVIVDSFAKTHFRGLISACRGSLYAYREGRYVRLDDIAEVKKPLTRYLGLHATSTLVESLFKLLQVSFAEVDEQFQPSPGMLCLGNGALNLETGVLHPHDPNHKLRTRLDIEWSQDATCPQFQAFLESIFRDDVDRLQKILFVQEWMGYLLVPDSSQQKMLWLLGQGANGKSVLMDLISRLVGQQNISNAMIDHFHQTFVRAELEGKLLNISSEIAADAMIDDGMIKAIVAGDVIEAQRKYKPSFSFKPYARLMAATNTLPRTNDVSHGFFRRTIILTFNRVFSPEEQNPHLIQDLILELPGILRWAVEGLHRLRGNRQFTIPTSSTDALNQYRVNANPVALFAQECLVIADRTGGMTPSDLYSGFRAWCQANGFQSLNNVNFGQRLRSLGFDKRKSNGRELWMVAPKEDATPSYFSTYMPYVPSTSALASTYAV